MDFWRRDENYETKIEKIMKDKLVLGWNWTGEGIPQANPFIRPAISGLANSKAYMDAVDRIIENETKSRREK